MAAAIPALMGAQMINSLVSGLLQQNQQSQQGNPFANAYRQGMQDGISFDKMQRNQSHDGEKNININFNPKDRILF